MNTQEDLLFSLGIIPIVAVSRTEDAIPLGTALLDGGLRAVEVTFRAGPVPDILRRICRELPDLLAGAGTITSVGQAKQAVDAGAAFITTAGYNPDVVKWCVDQKVPIYPGCATASEVEAAMTRGLKIVRFFPAEQSGGIETIKALCVPYPGMRFMPAGGLNFNTLADYLAFPRVFACCGSFIPRELVAQQRWTDITTLGQRAVQAAQGFTLRHVGIYTKGELQVIALGEKFAALTGKTMRTHQGSLFVGDELEIRTQTGSEKGRMVYTVINLERSCRFMERNGFVLDRTSAVRDAGGQLICIDLKESIEGFDVRLVLK